MYVLLTKRLLILTLLKNWVLPAYRQLMVLASDARLQILWVSGFAGIVQLTRDPPI